MSMLADEVVCAPSIYINDTGQIAGKKGVSREEAREIVWKMVTATGDPAEKQSSLEAERDRLFAGHEDPADDEGPQTFAAPKVSNSG